MFDSLKCFYPPDNFIIEDNGTSRFLRPYNSSSNRLQRTPQNDCKQGLGTSPTGSAIYTSSTSSGPLAVNVYVRDNATGERWYLRVARFTRKVTLECQAALDNVSIAITTLIFSEHLRHLCFHYRPLEVEDKNSSLMFLQYLCERTIIISSIATAHKISPSD